MKAYDYSKVKSSKGKLIHDTVPSMYGGYYTEVKYIDEIGCISMVAIGHSNTTKKSLVEAVQLFAEPLKKADVNTGKSRADYEIMVKDGDITIIPR